MTISLAQYLGFEAPESSFVEFSDGSLKGLLYLAGAKNVKQARKTTSPTFFVVLQCRTIKVGGREWLQPESKAFAELKACVRGHGVPVGTNVRTSVRFILVAEDGTQVEGVRVLPAKGGKRIHEYVARFNQQLGFAKPKV